MAWITRNSGGATIDRRAEPYLTEELKRELDEKYAHRFPDRRAMTIPVLHAIQHAYNWIPVQAMEEAAAFLGIPKSQVFDTATFYEEFFLEPRGRYTIWLCQSVSCEVMGEPSLTDYLRDKLGIEPGETTPDGKVTLMKIECIGACGGAPVALVNEKLHENLSVRNIDEILASLE